MTILLILLASVFTGVGIYHLSCAFVDVPTAGTSHMMMIAKKQTGSGSEKLFDVYLTKIADKLSPLLKMDPIKRNKLLLTLSRYSPDTGKLYHKGIPDGTGYRPCRTAFIFYHAADGLFSHWSCRIDVVFHLL